MARAQPAVPEVPPVPAPASPPAAPQVLSAEDVALYKDIFAAERKGDTVRADFGTLGSISLQFV